MSNSPIMTRLRYLLSITLMFTFLVSTYPLTAFAFPYVAAAIAIETPTKLERQVMEWTSTLAKQEPFSAWQGADPQIEALGPGTHSWLVLFTKEGRNIGYMVVNAIIDGSFQLGEYGMGPYPIFSEQLLSESLRTNGLSSTSHKFNDLKAIKHYISPFVAAWEVTIGEDSYWLDAKTAELLPINEQLWRQIIANQNGQNQKQVESSSLKEETQSLSTTAELILNEEFDAYERLPWLTKEAPFSTNNSKKLQQYLSNNNHLRYVIEPFGDEMLYAVSVVGYQRWANGRIDLALDMEGLRFIPLNKLISKGLFYR